MVYRSITSGHIQFEVRRNTLRLKFLGSDNNTESITGTTSLDQLQPKILRILTVFLWVATYWYYQQYEIIKLQFFIKAQITRFHPGKETKLYYVIMGDLFKRLWDLVTSMYIFININSKTIPKLFNEPNTMIWSFKLRKNRVYFHKCSARAIDIKIQDSHTCAWVSCRRPVYG